ncbi:MAG: PQQ-binding-like beta-propeller repeat protein [Cyclobacteriaceae bacterium]
MRNQIQRSKAFHSGVLLLIMQLLIAFACQQSPDQQYADENWASYLGDKSVSHYSTLEQITRENVSQLKMAWTYDGGDASPQNRSQIQCNPLIIDGILYGTSASLKLHALNAATGELIWQFDPNKDAEVASGVNRGVVFWQGEKEQRLYYAAGEFLFAIDPASGDLITSFGDEGRINLKAGYSENADDQYFTATSPGIIYENLYIMGGRLTEGNGSLPGHIRAYDLFTGEIQWVFHTIPHPGELGYETWPEDAYKRVGGANNWAGLSLDETRGIVYVPTGSASFDFFGGDREGANLFANSIIALDAKTGQRIWHYQTVHHDIWDRDLPAPPNLVTIEKDGELIDALAQITKSGHLFVLNRETGEPLYPIEEVAINQNTVEGEYIWPTQPIPTTYPTFSRDNLTEDDLAIRSPEAKARAKEIWNKSIKGAQFLAPSLAGTICFPGFDGGGEWGGAGLDPATNTLYVNSNEVSWELKLNQNKITSPGQGLYSANCQHCHGSELQGSDMFGKVPALVDVKNRLSQEAMKQMIRTGKGVMPAFRQFTDEEIGSLVDFLSGTEVQKEDVRNKDWPHPYFFNGYKRQYAGDRLPIIKPPWGQLTAIDLNEAKIKWQIPLGNIDSLDIPGHPITGTENYGGPVVTAGGLLFIAASADNKFRAFDKDTGVQLWEVTLPTSGFATPSTYSVDGKQYVVVACGGGKLEAKSGDMYVAFTL